MAARKPARKRVAKTARLMSPRPKKPAGKLGSGERFAALSEKIAADYRRRGYSWAEAEALGKATAGVVRMLTKVERKAAKDREKRVAQRVRRAA